MAQLRDFLTRSFERRPHAPFVEAADSVLEVLGRAQDDWDGPRSYFPLTFGMGESAVRDIHMIDWAFPLVSHVEPGQQFHAVLKINGAIQRNAANLEPVRMGVLKAPGTSDS